MATVIFTQVFPEDKSTFQIDLRDNSWFYKVTSLDETVEQRNSKLEKQIFVWEQQKDLDIKKLPATLYPLVEKQLALDKLNGVRETDTISFPEAVKSIAKRVIKSKSKK